MYNPLADSHKSTVYKKLKVLGWGDVVAFTAGNFDIIHPGYTATFEEAKRHCDKFIVFLHGDLHVRILGEDYLGKTFTGDDLDHEVIYTTRSHEWSTTKFKNRITAMTMIQNDKLRDRVLALLNDEDASDDILNGDFTQLER